jgi:sporulation-control protein
MFKRMLSAFGVGGPSVDTVLDSPNAMPGQLVTGQVRIQGGSADAEIGQVVLSLVPQAELFRVVVQQNVRVPAGQLVSIPFGLPIPWETPITAVGGTQLGGVNVAVRTELLIAGAPDRSDLDPVVISPLPSQDKVLDAVGLLGFSFRGTDAEVPQKLSFFPPAEFAGRVGQVELTFVTDAQELQVVLEADQRGGDLFGRFRVSHQEALVTDWASAISGWLAQAAERGGAHPAFAGQPSQVGRRSGPGMGGMLAAGAAGVVGGVVLSEMADEFFGDDED